MNKQPTKINNITNIDINKVDKICFNMPLINFITLRMRLASVMNITLQTNAKIKQPI